MRGLAAALLLCIGCSRAERIDLDLLIQDGVRSLVLVMDDGDTLRALAENVPEDGAIRLELLDEYVGAYPIELTAFVYQSPLGSFGLEEGGLAIMDIGVPIPSTTDRRRTTIHGESVDEWHAIGGDELGDRIAAVRLESQFDDAGCLDRGGCFNLDSASPSACIDCPAPPEPTAPDPPTPPDLSGCGGGWSVRTESGSDVCAPWIVRPSCASPEIALPGRETCVRIGSACPAGMYSDQIPGGAMVRYAMPGELSAMLTGAPAGTIVALAKGTFDEVATVPSGVTLLGACASQTSIRGVIAADGAQILDLSVAASGVAIAGSGTFAVIGVIASSPDTAIRADAGTTIQVANSLVRGAALVPGKLEVAESAVERVESTGEAALQDVLLEGNVKSSGKLTIYRGAMDGHAIRLEGGEATFEQLMVENSTAAPGMTVRLGTQATLRYGWVRNDDEADILVRGTDTMLGIEDSVISDARGDGVRVLAQGKAILAKTIVERTTGAAVFVDDVDSSAELFDVIVRDVTWNADLLSSNGIHLEAGTVLTVLRADVSRVAAHAFDLDGAMVDLTDVTVDTAGAGDCHQCTGICLYNAGHLMGRRLSVTNTTGRAIHSKGAGAVAMIDDVRVENVLPSATPCHFENPNSTPRLGQGVVAAESGSLDISRFLITGADGAGIALEEFDPESFGTTITASDGAVVGNASGAHLQVPDYPLQRIANRVVYRGNRVNVVR